jgi:AraC-like DNA-binding protein
MMTERGNFVIPPGHGLWIPAQTVHQSRAWGDAEIQTIYVEPDRVPRYPATCRLIRTSSLLDALMDETVRMPVDYDEEGRDGRLVDLLLGEIARMPEILLHVPIPQDPRLARICEAVIADTSADLTLDDWADRSGISRRTLTRMFRRETGQSFSAWRQRVRLLEALARLGAGESVTNVALDVGYDSPSAFTAMFRRELGAAPRRYLRWADTEVVLR